MSAAAAQSATHATHAALTHEWSVPVIDIAALTSERHAGRAEVVAALSAAVLSDGIFAVVGHGIQEDVMQRALAASKAALQIRGSADTEGWAELQPPPQALQPQERSEVHGVSALLGFGSLGSEVQAELLADTAAGAALRGALETYFGEVQRVSEVLHGGLSEAVGRPRQFISDMLNPHTEGLLRSNCYLPGHPHMAAHKDLGTTTLLLVDAPGLEFQPHSREEWIAAAAPKGALIVNIGEFFEIWTRGAW
eukprot:CAMPEP_0115139162 /NCGR_PEP_ID=MMETSP0227-20121206/58114_1 /TAXON_ID=89957 /ORGANISM="Polarella glacialis, Strain CCMP 1383" /LENGTH=250 /DNA_ID=CAMNT_0002546953 /DNA_START=56 /DNA_END=807 /DNA_ORIENTATION=-